MPLANLLRNPLGRENRDMVLAIAVVVVLILVGVFAMGMGGHLVANRGISAGVYGLMHLGMPRESLVRIGNGQENLVRIGNGQENLVPRQKEAAPPLGIYDTPAQVALGGVHSTIMGDAETTVHGNEIGGSLYDL